MVAILEILREFVTKIKILCTRFRSLPSSCNAARYSFHPRVSSWGRGRGGRGREGGVNSPKVWMGVCGALLEILTLSQTKR